MLPTTTQRLNAVRYSLISILVILIMYAVSYFREYAYIRGGCGIGVRRGAILFSQGPYPQDIQGFVTLIPDAWQLIWIPTAGRASGWFNCALPLWIPMLFPVIKSAMTICKLRPSNEERLCMSCGYNLLGNESGVCPECGKECSTISDE